MSARVSATIRMYRLNELGDCFLLSFAAGRSTSHMLIDCGSFSNSGASIERLQEIAGQISADLKGKDLDVVVGTHQHNDHVSGFLHCESEFAAMGINEVWLSWLDDPRDASARRIGHDYNNLRLQLLGAARSLQQVAGSRPLGAAAAESVDVLTALMGFSGLAADKDKDPPEVPAKAVAALKKLGREKPRYLKPGQVLEMPGLPAGSVRMHVLGPPRDDASLFRKDPRTGESYDHALTVTTRLAGQFVRAAAAHAGNAGTASGDDDYPFVARDQRRKEATPSKALAAAMARYDHAGAAWRKIDDDWMQQAASMALFLDKFTNNSSVVLAIELVESGKVLLFAADAQTGNWSSWDTVAWPAGHAGTDDLLARTVFYKVGHHASHNATLVKTFEKTGGPELCAFIPVHKQDPNVRKKNGWKMPAKGLFKRLVEKTKGRVLQMDGVNPPECDPEGAARGAWEDAGVAPNITNEAIEVVIKG
jgi:hypothetical protein